MLGKNRRLTEKEVKETFSQGVNVFDSDISLMFLKKPKDNPSKFALSVSSKIAKNAVKRNTLRRFGYNIIASIAPYVKKGYYCVFIVKKDISLFEKNKISATVKKLLQKSGALDT